MWFIQLYMCFDFQVENLKQALADVEEKVQYQSEERVRDIHEMLELCQTKVKHKI